MCHVHPCGSRLEAAELEGAEISRITSSSPRSRLGFLVCLLWLFLTATFHTRHPRRWTHSPLLSLDLSILDFKLEAQKSVELAKPRETVWRKKKKSTEDSSKSQPRFTPQFFFSNYSPPDFKMQKIIKAAGSRTESRKKLQNTYKHDV